jgi:hypothetical protein
MPVAHMEDLQRFAFSAEVEATVREYPVYIQHEQTDAREWRTLGL